MVLWEIPAALKLSFLAGSKRTKRFTLEVEQDKVILDCP